LIADAALRSAGEYVIGSLRKGRQPMAGTSTPTVVLVHGAFADASGFGGVIRELQSLTATTRPTPSPPTSDGGLGVMKYWPLM
jgi:hypothetical protein